MSSRKSLAMHPEWEPWWPEPCRRIRKPTLASALKAAGKAGVAVAGATVNADGSVSLAFGNALTSGEERQANEWDEVLQ